MRLLSRLFVFLLIAVPLALSGAVFLAIDDQPTVNRAAEFTPENIERAKRILDRNDPRKLKPGMVRTISVSQADLDLAANYLVHRYARGSARVVLKDGAMEVNASAGLPRNPIGSYVNVDARLTGTTALPRFEYLRIGRLPVPAPVANWLLARALVQLQRDEDLSFTADVVKRVSVADGRLAVTYQWQSDLPDKLRAVLLPREDQGRLRVYHERLAEGTRSLPAENVSLVELLRPLFQLAQERSSGNNPVAENRAAILVLTLYVNGKGFETIIPAAKDWSRPTPHHVTLNGRDDFSQHFIISAALAANAGGPLSDAVGLYKEVADSRGGSGFSFNDIAADRAGTRFGEEAAGSAASATKLQRQFSTGPRERDLMPATEDLPEFMPEAEFKRRFGGIGAPAYNQMMSKIERRITALTLYR